MDGCFQYEITSEWLREVRFFPSRRNPSRQVLSALLWPSEDSSLEIGEIIQAFVALGEAGDNHSSGFDLTKNNQQNSKYHFDVTMCYVFEYHFDCIQIGGW